MSAAFLPSWPYPPERKNGYWEPITSTLDWCEENYYATDYAAEIVNTVTNFFFMWLAIKGAYNCWQHGHDRIFLITFLGFFVVGAGSFAFHATLKYPMQLVDELSMIYTTCLMFWATFSFKRSLFVQVLIGVFSASLSVFITGYYHYLQDPTFHQTAYAVLTAIVLFRSMFVMELNLRPYYRRKREQHGLQRAQAGKAEVARQDARDKEILMVMWTMIPCGLSIFLAGFAVWTLDNQYCSQIRAWRHSVGLPWGLLSEGHGWWHLMTGTGAYFYIVWGIWLRHCLNGRQDEFELIWPSMGTSLPRVERRTNMQNGDVKKRD